MKLLVFISIFLIGSTIGDEGDAKLVLIKTVLNDIITEGQDLAVEYKLFNIGDGTASDVILADTTFPDTAFEVVKGLSSVKWDFIHSASNVSHLLVMRPIKSGPFNFTSSVVQYVASEGSDSTFGYSNEIGELDIITLKDFNRIYASHLFDWCFFALWCIPSLLFPYGLFYSSKRKFTVPMKAKKANYTF